MLEHLLLLLLSHILLHATGTAAHVIVHLLRHHIHHVGLVVAHPLLVAHVLLLIVEIILLHASHHLIIVHHRLLEVVHAATHHLLLRRHLVVVLEQRLLHVVVGVVLHQLIRARLRHRIPLRRHSALPVKHGLIELILVAHHARVRFEIIVIHLTSSAVGHSASSASSVRH